MRSWRALLAALAAVLALASCSDDGGGDDGASLGVTSAPTEVTAPSIPPPSAVGTGVIVLGGASSSFAITVCRLAADPTDPVGAQTLVLITGTGTTAGGVGFEVELKRFATGTDVTTYTDTVAYTDAGRILQAQRIEVNGQVSDLRDPSAVSTMIRVRADGASAVGLAGPPGEGADADGTVGVAFDATCAP